MQVVLISTYELGRQPFGLASPAARLLEAGIPVTCVDLAVEQLDAPAITTADLIAFYLPMHTATRLAVGAVERVRLLNPTAHLCFYGLYAPVNEAYLRSLGAGTILGGEFEDGLVSLATRLANGRKAAPLQDQVEPVISRARQRFVVPDRSRLPPLDRYARLIVDGQPPRVTGYTEATRGCKHQCRHCPIVPVYAGLFRAVPRQIVLDDIERQVAAGARHITFGDPDFFNGPGHALALVEELHRHHPDLTYDVTIKVQHLLQRAAQLPILRDTGCLFITSAVESVDDRILAILDKHHTRADVVRVVALLREVGLTLNPTLVSFTPWTTIRGYRDLLHAVWDLDLVEHIAPIQYAIRLLIPAGSRLLELANVQELVGQFDERALSYPWANPDPRVDALYEDVRTIVEQGVATTDRWTVFQQVWRQAHAGAGHDMAEPPRRDKMRVRAPLPRMSEPWFC